MKLIKFCSCRMCRSGRHCAASKSRTKKAMRAARRQWNRAARTGNDETIGPISIPYTD